MPGREGRYHASTSTARSATASHSDSNFRGWSAYPPIPSVNEDIPVQQPSINCGLMHCNKYHAYSITSSARASSIGGTVRPSALADFRIRSPASAAKPDTIEKVHFCRLFLIIAKQAAKQPPYGIAAGSAQIGSRTVLGRKFRDSAQHCRLALIFKFFETMPATTSISTPFRLSPVGDSFEVVDVAVSHQFGNFKIESIFTFHAFQNILGKSYSFCINHDCVKYSDYTISSR
jgi:hypothetical protein